MAGKEAINICTLTFSITSILNNKNLDSEKDVRDGMRSLAPPPTRISLPCDVACSQYLRGSTVVLYLKEETSHRSSYQYSNSTPTTSKRILHQNSKRMKQVLLLIHSACCLLCYDEPIIEYSNKSCL